MVGVSAELSLHGETGGERRGDVLRGELAANGTSECEGTPLGFSWREKGSRHFIRYLENKKTVSLKNEV